MNIRETVIKHYYVLICIMIESLNYKKVEEYISKMLENNFSVIQNLKELSVPSDIINCIKEIKKYNYSLNEKEKCKINELAVNIYKAVYYSKLAKDKTRTYKERERNNYKYILASIRYNKALKELLNNTNLDKEFSSFKNDFKDYASNLAVISDAVDNKDGEDDIKVCIQYRRTQAKNLVKKYGDIFDVTEDILRTSFEQEIIERKRQNKLISNNKVLVKAIEG